MIPDLTPPVFADSLARRSLPPPVAPGAPISFYACGITPYAPAHIGHARSFVVFDLMARVLRAHGHSVDLVRNITDIDDKIIQAAAQSDQDWRSLSHGFAVRNRQELDALGLADFEEPYASDHIPAIIDLVSRLIARGHAYLSTTGDVLFEVASFQGAALMPHDREAMLDHAAHRVSSEGKRSPLDFVLWKRAKLKEPSWASPWGEGRPGWHIECSAMVEQRFAGTLAYHGGGNDLRFPHHQAEIQQSEAAFDRPLAHRWVHHGSVHDAQGRKMSKSLGNTVILADALAEGESLLPGAGGLVVRLALLSALWTRPLDWSPALLGQAVGHLRAWAQASAGADPDPIAASKFLILLSDNLNTPRAFAWLHETATRARAGDLQAATALAYALELLGVSESLRAHLSAAPSPVEVPTDIQALLDHRQSLRTSKDWAQADAVRQAIEALGYRVIDKPGNEPTVERIAIAT